MISSPLTAALLFIAGTAILIVVELSTLYRPDTDKYGSIIGIICIIYSARIIHQYLPAPHLYMSVPASQGAGEIAFSVLFQFSVAFVMFVSVQMAFAHLAPTIASRLDTPVQP